MDREQIIKALELHSQKMQPCLADCPYGGLHNCESDMAQDALSLINELTVELDAMRGAANSYKMHYEKLTEENERLRANNLTFAHGVEKVAANYYNLGCTDTVRKMKESIIEKACSLSMVNGEGKVIKIDYQISPERLDQIAEEMIGEAK